MKGIMLSNFKKLVALLSVFTLLLVYLPVSVASADTAVVYQNDFEGAGVTGFFQSGNATLSVSTDQKSGGAQSLKVETKGGKDYDGAQIPGDDAGLVLGGKYRISAKVYAPSEPVQLVMQIVLVKASDGKDDYKWLANKTYTAGDTGWSTFESDLDLTTGDYTDIKNIQFVKGGGNTTNITFYIDDFTVTELSAPSSPSVYKNDFEGASVTGFFQSGNATLSVSTDQKAEELSHSRSRPRAEIHMMELRSRVLPEQHWFLAKSIVYRPRSMLRTSRSSL